MNFFSSKSQLMLVMSKTPVFWMFFGSFFSYLKAKKACFDLVFLGPFLDFKKSIWPKYSFSKSFFTKNHYPMLKTKTWPNSIGTLQTGFMTFKNVKNTKLDRPSSRGGVDFFSKTGYLYGNMGVFSKTRKMSTYVTLSIYISIVYPELATLK